MKNLLFAVTAMLLTGCHYSTVDYMFDNEIGIVVKDAAGRNLLDPNNAENILDHEITAEYKGQIYKVGGGTEGLGLQIGDYTYFNPVTALVFGRLEGETNNLEELIVNWGDGTSNMINFEYKITWGWGVQSGNKYREEAVEYKRIWLNGEFVSDNSLIVEVVK